MKSKSIFTSKTFWLNAIGVATLVVPGLNIAPATIGIILAALNIGNRVLTQGPVHVLTDAGSSR